MNAQWLVFDSVQVRYSDLAGKKRGKRLFCRLRILWNLVVMHIFEFFVRGLPVLATFVGRDRWLGFFKGHSSCLTDMHCVEVCLLNLLNSVVVDMEISSLFFGIGLILTCILQIVVD
jgi:hypothetical protein